MTEQEIATYKQILEFLETPPVEVNLDEALREFDFKLQNQIENCGFEALLWLESASQNRGFTGGAGSFSALTGQKAIAFVEKNYALGAECVSVIDVIPDANEGLQTVESVIVTLPAGKAALLCAVSQSLALKVLLNVVGAATVAVLAVVLRRLPTSLYYHTFS